MSYTPTSWSTGDTITAAAMNKIENGIANAGGVLICNTSYDGNEDVYVLDKTVQEIYDALLAGTPAYIKFQYGVLGASGTGTYESHLFLAQIIKIYGYGYVNTVRVIASRPVSTQMINNKNYISAPALAIFSASGMNDYPTMHANVYVPANYLAADGSIV